MDDNDGSWLAQGPRGRVDGKFVRHARVEGSIIASAPLPYPMMTRFVAASTKTKNHSLPGRRDDRRRRQTASH
jgi:hypothetical protein